MTEPEFFKKIQDNEPYFVLTEEIKKAFRLAEFIDTNLFITGSAGTSKSTFLKMMSKYSSKKMIVVAPTGVAAINVEGQTMHSFFRFPIGILDGKQSPSSILMESWESFEILYIDEISMVRADLFNAVDKVMRRAGDKTKPFGGKQVIISGDLWQLPPVVGKNEKEVFSQMFNSRWFFANESASLFDIIEFTEVFRQADKGFVEILNRFRKGLHSYADINYLNNKRKHYEGDALVITTTNSNADAINKNRLDKIKAKEYRFTGQVSGSFSESSMIAPMSISLKVGAKIMVLRNFPKLGLVNGSIRYVRSICKEHDEYIMISKSMFDTESEWQRLDETTWEQYEYVLIDKELSKEVVGTYTQLPVKLGFAVTCHKAQGVTVDEAVIDFDRGVFECGQAYVALSRVKSLEGIHLCQPLKMTDFRIDADVKNYFRESNKTVI